GGELRHMDYTIRLWDPAAGRLVHSLRGHEKPVTAMAFSPDGRTLASGSEDGTIRLWELASGKDISQLKGQPFAARSLAFSSNGKPLAGAESTGYRLWDVATGKECCQLSWKPEGTQDRAMAIAFLPKDRGLITASENGRLRLWDATTGKEQHPHQGPSSGLRQLIFAGNAVAGIDDGQLIHVWDASTGKMLRSLSRDGMTTCLAAYADGKLAAGTATGALYCWDVGTGKEQSAVLGHSPVRAVTFSLDGKALAAVAEHAWLSKFEGKWRGTTLLLWNSLEPMKQPTQQRTLNQLLTPYIGDVKDVDGFPVLTHTLRGWQKIDASPDAISLGFCP